jgi:hypothetical protein
VAVSARASGSGPIRVAARGPTRAARTGTHDRGGLRGGVRVGPRTRAGAGGQEGRQSGFLGLLLAGTDRVDRRAGRLL